MLRLPLFLACIPAAFALYLLLSTQPLIAAPSSAQKQSAQQTATGTRASKTAPDAAASKTQAAASTMDVYGQAPYTEKELIRFIESLPHFLAWARAHKIKAYPVVNTAGKPDFAYTPEAATKAQELHWEARRFFCLFGRTAAALYIVEEGTDLMNALPPDMPTVTDAEILLVRKHLASLLRAGAGGPAPALAR